MQNRLYTICAFKVPWALQRELILNNFTVLNIEKCSGMMFYRRRILSVVHFQGVSCWCYFCSSNLDLRSDTGRSPVVRKRSTGLTCKGAYRTTRQQCPENDRESS
jgi:hypothetical protein